MLYIRTSDIYVIHFSHFYFQFLSETNIGQQNEIQPNLGNPPQTTAPPITNQQKGMYFSRCPFSQLTWSSGRFFLDLIGFIGNRNSHLDRILLS